MAYLLKLLVAAFLVGAAFGRPMNPEIVKFAIRGYNGSFKNPNAFVIDNVSYFKSKRLLSGWVDHTIKAYILETDCPNTADVYVDKCNLKANGKALECTFRVETDPQQRSKLLASYCSR